MAASKTVLVVAGDREARDLLRDSFDLLRYDVIGVSHCDLALLYLSLEGGAPPNLVVVDLPIANPVCRRMLDRIRRDPEIADVPVLFLSASLPERVDGASVHLANASADAGSDRGGPRMPGRCRRDARIVADVTSRERPRLDSVLAPSRCVGIRALWGTTCSARLHNGVAHI